MTWIVALALASLLFWLGLTADRRRAWPGERLLREDPPKAHVEVSEPVVAIVPARNEAEVLPRTLPALLAQEGIDLQVILVDDGSNDGTAVRAVALARENGFEDRLQVLQAGSRPPEWSGKIHALHCGYQYLLSQGRESLRWVLFTDADIEHRPGSVRDLLDRAVEGDETGSWDLVSVMARLRADDFWEKLMIPAFVFFFQLLYPFRRVADPGSSVAAAAGGCVLISRQVLEHTGGLPVIAEESVAAIRAVIELRS